MFHDALPLKTPVTPIIIMHTRSILGDKRFLFMEINFKREFKAKLSIVFFRFL